MRERFFPPAKWKNKHQFTRKQTDELLDEERKKMNGSCIPLFLRHICWQHQVFLRSVSRAWKEAIDQTVFIRIFLVNNREEQLLRRLQLTQSPLLKRIVEVQKGINKQARRRDYIEKEFQTALVETNTEYLAATYQDQSSGNWGPWSISKKFHVAFTTLIAENRASEFPFYAEVLREVFHLPLSGLDKFFADNYGAFSPQELRRYSRQFNHGWEEPLLPRYDHLRNNREWSLTERDLYQLHNQDYFTQDILPSGPASVPLCPSTQQLEELAEFYAGSLASEEDSEYLPSASDGDPDSDPDNVFEDFQIYNSEEEEDYLSELRELNKRFELLRIE